MKKGQKSTIDQRGEKNPNWKGGRPFNGNGGYLFVRINGVMKRHHRVVMEKHLGRKLKETECVHHKNGDIQDNRISNLELMTFRVHAKHHEFYKHGWKVIKNRRDSKGRFNKTNP